MVIVEPYPTLPGIGTPNPWIDPYPLPAYPEPDTHWHYYYPREEKKIWKEKHIKNVKRGILITFEGSEEPIFIATDDKCFEKIMEAIKDEPKKKHE